MIFTEGERHIWKRREFLSVSRWAARNVIVQDGPYRGARMKLDVTPYLPGIMDAWSRPGVEMVMVCGAPQTGKTLAMYSCLGYAVDRRPGTKMLAMPDDEVAGRVEREKLRPLLTASPGTSSLVGKITRGTVEFKDGSSLFISSAQSPSQRASITVQDLFLDEEDLYQAGVGKGDPVTDFIERTGSYKFNRKIMRVSKPVGDARSSIWRAVTEEADVTYAWEAVCPSCFGRQFFDPDRVRAVRLLRDGGDAEASPAEIIRARLGRYACAHCESLWTDAQRDLAVAVGRWKPVSLGQESGRAQVRLAPAEEPEGARRLGFYLPGILSRSVSLSDIAAGRLRAEHADDPTVEQAYRNGVWAQPYVAVVLEPDEKLILARAQKYLPARTVPHGAVALTCGIDTQKRGFYYLVLAWMPDMTKYVIDYGRLAEFDDVSRLVWDAQYPVLGADDRPDGSVMPIWRAGMDTGGTGTDEGVYTRTEEVYEYLRLYGHNVIHAMKGASRDQAQVVRWSVLDRLPQRQTKIPGGLMLYTVDVSKIKGALFVQLLDPEAHRPVKLYGHDPERATQEGLHDELAAHLCAERQVRSTNGKLVWEVIRRENHYLDCLTLATACGDVSWTPSLHHVIMQIKAAAEAGVTSAPQPHRERKPKRGRARW